MTTATCLRTEGRLSYLDRQRHVIHEFDVTQSGELILDFEFDPSSVGAVRNLVTVALYDSEGVMRGAAHRWQSPQHIRLGEWRATPGFVPGPITPGTWRCILDVHEVMNTGAGDDWCRYVLLIRSQPEIGASGETVHPEAIVRPTRFDERWYQGDLHSHTVHCDGSAETLAMGEAARDIGLDFLAITGHNTTSSTAIPANWPSEVIPIPGIEITTFAGHAGALGIDQWIEWRSCAGGSLRSAQTQVRKSGGTFVINHPAAIGNPWCTGCTWGAVDVDFGLVDAIEVWNGPWANRESRNETALAFWDRLLLDGLRIAGVGGGDAHSADQLLTAALPVTSVYANRLDASAIQQGVKASHVVVSVGPSLSFEASSSRVLPGEEAEAGTIAVTVDRVEQSLELIRIADGCQNDVRRVVPPGGIFTFDVRDSKLWSRWELRTPDHEMIALTNPVYRPSSR